MSLLKSIGELFAKKPLTLDQSNRRQEKEIFIAKRASVELEDLLKKLKDNPTGRFNVRYCTNLHKLEGLGYTVKHYNTEAYSCGWKVFIR